MPEIVDPVGLHVDPPVRDDAYLTLAARRAFYRAQELLSGSPSGTVYRLSVGWHDSSVSPETGSFAVVALGGGLDDLIGEVVQVNYRRRRVWAYVIGSADVPVQLSLTRRVFAALSILTPEQINATAVVAL